MLLGLLLTNSVSFPVNFLGTIELEQSLRTVEFQFRNKIVQDAISRVRDSSRMRPPSKRVVTELAEEFLGPQEPELSMLDINLSISTAGIVISNSTQDSVIENHRMANISFAAGGDFEVRAICTPPRLFCPCRGPKRRPFHLALLLTHCCLDSLTAGL